MSDEKNAADAVRSRADVLALARRFGVVAPYSVGGDQGGIAAAGVGNASTSGGQLNPGPPGPRTRPRGPRGDDHRRRREGSREVRFLGELRTRHRSVAVPRRRGARHPARLAPAAARKQNRARRRVFFSRRRERREGASSGLIAPKNRRRSNTRRPISAGSGAVSGAVSGLAARAAELVPAGLARVERGGGTPGATRGAARAAARGRHPAPPPSSAPATRRRRRRRRRQAWPEAALHSRRVGAAASRARGVADGPRGASSAAYRPCTAGVENPPSLGVSGSRRARGAAAERRVATRRDVRAEAQGAADAPRAPREGRGGTASGRPQHMVRAIIYGSRHGCGGGDDGVAWATSGGHPGRVRRRPVRESEL